MCPRQRSLQQSKRLRPLHPTSASRAPSFRPPCTQVPLCVLFLLTGGFPQDWSKTCEGHWHLGYVMRSDTLKLLQSDCNSKNKAAFVLASSCHWQDHDVFIFFTWQLEAWGLQTCCDRSLNRAFLWWRIWLPRPRTWQTSGGFEIRDDCLEPHVFWLRMAATGEGVREGLGNNGRAHHVEPTWGKCACSASCKEVSGCV